MDKVKILVVDDELIKGLNWQLPASQKLDNPLLHCHLPYPKSLSKSQMELY